MTEKDQVRSRASSHRGERAEDTSSASSLVEVELVERNGHSGEDAVARFFLRERIKINNISPHIHLRFRDYLLHGNKAEGLEFAMRSGLWGHALFLSSKMDQRTYAGVMTRSKPFLERIITQTNAFCNSGYWIY